MSSAPTTQPEGEHQQSSALPVILDTAECFSRVAGSYDAKAAFASRNGGEMWQVFKGGSVVGPTTAATLLLNAADSWGTVYGLLLAAEKLGDTEALRSCYARLSEGRTAVAALILERGGEGLCEWVGTDPLRSLKAA